MNKYDIAAIAATNDLEGDYHKVPAAKQREMFGRVVFGRKSIHFDPANQGTVRILYTVAFGKDSHIEEISYEEFAQSIQAGLKF